MNDRELEMFVLLILKEKCIDDCNPDVDMHSLAEDVAKQLSFDVYPCDISIAANLAERRYANR